LSLPGKMHVHSLFFSKWLCCNFHPDMSFSPTVLEQWMKMDNLQISFSYQLFKEVGKTTWTSHFNFLVFETHDNSNLCVCRNAFNPLIILWSSWENVALMVGWARTETCSRGWLCEKFRNQKIENFSQCRFFEKYLLNFEHIIELGLWKLLKNPSKTNSNQIGKWNVFVVWRKIIKQN